MKNEVDGLILNLPLLNKLIEKSEHIFSNQESSNKQYDEIQ